MTLIVSLRIPDGIVIAGDSLATMTGSLEPQTTVQVECPDCGHKHNLVVQLPSINVTAATFSYSQKVFPFLKKYGVGTSGAAQLAGKTIYFAVRQLEYEFLDSNQNEPNGVKEAADLIGKHLHKLLEEQVVSEKKKLADMPDNWRPLQVQIVGYEKDKPLTIELRLGKDVQTTIHTDAGLTATGITEVASALFGIYKTKPHENPVYEVFSLQDAIMYAEFLINTTAHHQRFSRTIPNVGGDIDIALVTPFDNFKWIQQKSLSKILEAKS
jgi:hypothetical protein